MKEFIFNKNDYASYKDFYVDIAKQLDAKNDLNCLEPEDLGFNANHLYEFLRDFNDENYKYVFIGFDLEKISQQKNIDDYEWEIIIKVFKDFVKKYPDNTLEFINDED